MTPYEQHILAVQRLGYDTGHLVAWAGITAAVGWWTADQQQPWLWLPLPSAAFLILAWFVILVRREIREVADGI